VGDEIEKNGNLDYNKFIMKRSELFFAFFQIPVDIVAIIVAFIISYYIRAHLGSVPDFNNIGLSEYLKDAIYLIPFWIFLFAANGLYSIKSSTGFFNELYRISIGASTAILFFVTFIFFSKTFFFSRLVLVFIWLVSIVTLMLGRLVLRLIQKSLLKTGMGVRNIVLIGNNTISQDINKELRSAYSGYKVIGVIGSDEKNTGLKIIGDLDNLAMIIKKYSIDEVILTDNGLKQDKTLQIIESCSDKKVSFKYVPDIFALMSTNYSSGLIGSTPVFEIKPIPLDGWGRILKRLFDILFSSILIIILSPILLILTILIKLTSKGPVFFIRPRIGRDDSSFNFYKFRSMYIDKCDYKGATWTTQKDEKTRITPFGKFIRTTNLDELPQLFNIIKGDMSFVGPRPEVPQLVAKFSKEIPEYFRRHRVKSGLTGWAQVNGLKGDSSVKERVNYDIYYIENWSIWFDLKIVIKTIWLIVYEIINGKSEYRPGA
jgi:exopolysaccharide biosynthesis polyprenyl glycosylphosphotransferase